MKTIEMYPLRILSVQTISVLENFTFLRIGLNEEGIPSIWGEINKVTNSYKQITIYFIATGETIPAQATKYLGSFIEWPEMWHCYTNY